MLVYESVNYPVLELVGSLPLRILDIGCGSGTLGRELKTREKHEIWGVTYSNEEAELARSRLDKVLVADLNTFEPINLPSFDLIICSHILEHLYDPVLFLKRIKPCLNTQGRVIIALPNILYWKQRLKFVKGSFQYTDGGLMDRTHFRFFDYPSAHQLPLDAGYALAQSVTDGHFPLPVVRRLLPHSWIKSFEATMVKKWPGLFGFQFVMVCQKK